MTCRNQLIQRRLWRKQSRRAGLFKIGKSHRQYQKNS